MKTMTQAPIIQLEHEHDLVARWRSGEELAMRQLFIQHHARLYRLAIALLGNPADAEDIAQQALIDGLLSPEKFDPERGELGPWLTAIVVNNCRQHLRKQKRLGATIKRWLAQRRPIERLVDHDTPEHLSELGARGAMVRAALDELPVPLREAVVLRLWGGYSYKQIADIVGCPTRTAQSRVRLAIESLRRIIPASDQKATP